MIAASPNKLIDQQFNANNNQLIDLIIKSVPLATDQLKNFSQSLPNDPVEFNRALFNYVRQNITYKRDDDDNQVIQLPSKINTTKVGDCKSIALFIAAANAAKGIKSGFRFVSYGKPGRVGYSHVYNYFIKDGKMIPLDGCLEKPFTESPPIKKLMNASVIAGVDGIGKSAKRQRKQTARKAKRAVKKTGRKARRAKNKAEGKGLFRKAWQATKKVVGSPGRGAFLALIGTNTRGLASRTSAGLKKNEKNILAAWKRVGGDPEKLKKAVTTGAQKKPLLGSHKIGDFYVAEDFRSEPIGVVVAATTAAAAAPILVVILGALSKVLGNKENPELAAFAAEASAANPERIDSGTQITDSEVEGGGFPPEASGKQSYSDDDSDGDDAEGSGFQLSTPLILGVLGVGAFALSRMSNN